jgi:hypothetical protein
MTVEGRPITAQDIEEAEYNYFHGEDSSFSEFLLYLSHIFDPLLASMRPNIQAFLESYELKQEDEK